MRSICAGIHNQQRREIPDASIDHVHLSSLGAGISMTLSSEWPNRRLLALTNGYICKALRQIRVVTSCIITTCCQTSSSAAAAYWRLTARSVLLFDIVTGWTFPEPNSCHPDNASAYWWLATCCNRGTNSGYEIFRVGWWLLTEAGDACVRQWRQLQSHEWPICIMSKQMMYSCIQYGKLSHILDLHKFLYTQSTGITSIRLLGSSPPLFKLLGSLTSEPQTFCHIKSLPLSCFDM